MGGWWCVQCVDPVNRHQDARLGVVEGDTLIAGVFWLAPDEHLVRVGPSKIHLRVLAAAARPSLHELVVRRLPSHVNALAALRHNRRGVRIGLVPITRGIRLEVGEGKLDVGLD